VFALAEAMIDGAQRAGLSSRDAHEAVMQTIIGAAAMLAETSGEGRPSPSVLRERVTSPGGTTQAGLAAMQQAGFAASVRAAVLAARDRGRELGAIAQGEA
jgi:pyrroline-5-carboxylate reductase